MDTKVTYNFPKFKDDRRRLRKDCTEAEKILWNQLRNKRLGEKFYRQFGIENFIVDFCCWGRKLIIELDGEIHDQKDIAEHDQFRQDNLEALNFKIIRFKNKEILNNINSVLEKIKKHLSN